MVAEKDTTTAAACDPPTAQLREIVLFSHRNRQCCNVALICIYCNGHDDNVLHIRFVSKSTNVYMLGTALMLVMVIKNNRKQTIPKITLKRACCVSVDKPSKHFLLRMHTYITQDKLYGHEDKRVCIHYGLALNCQVHDHNHACVFVWIHVI